MLNCRGVGLLVTSLPAVQYRQLHYRYLEIDKNIALKIAREIEF